MNYCSAEDVQVALGYSDAFTATTRPTLAQVNVIIENITNEIDLYLNMVGIADQPTDTRILGRLKEMCTIGSSARVGFGYMNNSDNVSNSLADKYWTRYIEMLKEIKEDPEIYGVTSDSTSFITSNVIDGTTTESATKALFQEFKP